MEKAKVTFENGKGEGVVVNISQDKKGVMTIKIDFGDKGAAALSDGLYIGLMDLFVNSLYGK